ncbi:MAG TPA: YkgJ family cysteine cluster protein, partial [Polyangiaceae bacterium]|nr:YkgJ family cysteine cluster protein [Polyangiaceae bacterium]
MSKKKRPPAKRGADGRLHLALHQDASGRAHVTLRAPLFEGAWQNEIATGAANTALAIFGSNPSSERAVALAERAMGAASQLAEGLLSRAPAGSVACKAGCDHCCHQSVAATAPEAFAISEHLQRTRSAAELSDVSARIAVRFERTRGLSADERFSPDLPCAFLVAGQCSIYEVRPLVCRGMNSLDAKECELRLRDEPTRAAFLAQGHGGHCYLEPIRAAQAISAGLQLAGSELYGLDMRPLDLTAAIHLLLSDRGA